MSAAKHLATYSDNVATILSKYPEARLDNKQLYINYLEEFHQLSKEVGPKGYTAIIDLIKRPDVPSFETLGRLKRVFQKRGLFLVSEQTRKEHKENVRQIMRGL